MAKTTLASNAQPTRNDRHSCANLVNIQCSYNSPPTSVHNPLHDSRSHSPLSVCNPLNVLSVSNQCLHSSSSNVHTPFNALRLRELLRGHPNPEFVLYVFKALHHGFDIGFTASRNVSVISNNLLSASLHSSFISEQLAASCLRGETAGPFPAPPFPHLRCSGVEAVPKKNGKLRMIHHLSSPHGNSVNDGIPSEPFSLHYVSIDDGINLIMSSAKPVYLSKLDVKSAFRPLLGIKWQGQFYYEKVLPFGLRSSPAIFDAVASAIKWMMQHQFSIYQLLHYLDDFLFVSSGAVVANQQLSILLREFVYLGVPLAPAKVEGPVSCLTSLGITLDCIRLEARLPLDNLVEIRSLLTDTVTRRRISQRNLEFLLGKLSFAARVIVPGRTFMRRLWSVCSRYQEPHFTIVLSQYCIADLNWWIRLLADWNGKSFFLHPDWTPSPDLQLFTDASGTRGWGAYNNGCWIQGEWTQQQLSNSIEWKELYALAVACTTWGREWSQLRILVHCDNMCVVECVRTGTSKAPAVMQLLRELFFVCAKCNFTLSAGSINTIADALSRLHMQVFRQKASMAREMADVATLPQLP